MQIVLIAVQSIDGFITRHDEPGTAFASEEDQSLFRELLSTCDASVMGGATYEVARQRIRASLTPERIRFVLTSRPERFVDEQVPGVLEFTQGGPAEIIDRLRKLGRKRLAVLGGGVVNRLFLQSGRVDELWLTVESVLFGTGVPLCNGQVDLGYQVAEVRKLSARTLFLRYVRAGGTHLSS